MSFPSGTQGKETRATSVRQFGNDCSMVAQRERRIDANVAQRPQRSVWLRGERRSEHRLIEARA